VDRPLLVVVGPTAVGKSEFALLACEHFGGEVVSVDSMQVYRGLDRGPPSRDPRRAAGRRTTASTWPTRARTSLWVTSCARPGG